MNRKSEMARQRITSMSDEELCNEIRRLAGLETKDMARRTGSISDKSGDAAFGDEPVSDDCERSTAATNGSGLEDLAVHGRSRRGQDKSGR